MGYERLFMCILVSIRARPEGRAIQFVNFLRAVLRLVSIRARPEGRAILWPS